MLRSEFIQAIANLYDRPAYLEVGVAEGTTFRVVRAHRKVAVDPAFQFDAGATDAGCQDDGCSYHEVTSDDYFTKVNAGGELFDIIFLDGLHHFDQTLRDLHHCMDRLRPGGAIIVDDVLPTSYGASLRELEDSAKFRRMTDERYLPRAWMGDVYKLIFYIRDYLLSYTYATLDCDHAMLVLWREMRQHDVPPLTIEAITRLEYKDVVFRPRAYRFRKLEDILDEIAVARAVLQAAESRL